MTIFEALSQLLGGTGRNMAEVVELKGYISESEFQFILNSVKDNTDESVIRCMGIICLYYNRRPL